MASTNEPTAQAQGQALQVRHVQGQGNRARTQAQGPQEREDLSTVPRAGGAVTHYLTTAEVAERYRVSPRTVEGWRQLGAGPRFVRPGGKEVRYPVAELERFDRELLSRIDVPPSQRWRAS